MLHKEYGRTGKSLGAIACGGMRLPNPRNPEEGIAVLHAARRAGIVYFDTAPYYCEDKSEEIFGAALRTLPPSPLPLYVSSKCSAPKADDFRRGLERSLTRLGVPGSIFSTFGASWIPPTGEAASTAAPSAKPSRPRRKA